MRAVNRNRPIEGMSFWDQLEEDIDKIGHRAKDKLQNYQLKQIKTARQNPQIKPTTIKLNVKKTRSKSVTSDDFSKNLSVIDRRQLQKLQKVQSEKQSMMKNRLAYFHHEKQRQNKTIQLAKKKFEQIVTIRTQSFRNKQAIKKKITSLQVEDKNQKDHMVQYVKTGRQKKNSSLSNWKSLISQNAQQIRNQTINNESLAALQRQKSKEMNFHKAHQTKKGLERSRSIVSQVRQKRVNETRNQRKQQLSNRLKFLNQQKKTNQEILNRLKQQTQRVTKWKSRAQRQIEQYRSYLGYNPKNSNQKFSSKQSQKSFKSFYITHF